MTTTLLCVITFLCLEGKMIIGFEDLKNDKVVEEYYPNQVVLDKQSGRKTVIIPDVEYIDDTCYFSMTDIDFVKIPANVKYVGEGAFQYCDSLKTIEWGREKADSGKSDFLKIKKDAFACTAISRLYIPKDVILCSRAFASCQNLKDVKILCKKENLKAKLDDIFYRCDKIQAIVLPLDVALENKDFLMNLKSLKRLVVFETDAQNNKTKEYICSKEDSNDMIFTARQNFGNVTFKDLLNKAQKHKNEEFTK